MRLEMIGVQFDQPGHDEVAGGILAAGRRSAFAELGDTAICDGDPAALDHAVGEHDAGIAEDGFAADVISFLPSCGSGKRGHVDDAVGNQMADLVVMDDRDHRHALALLLGDQFDHDGAVGGIERGRRLVQQQDRQVGNEAARDVDALLLAARRRSTAAAPTAARGC